MDRVNLSANGFYAVGLDACKCFTLGVRILAVGHRRAVQLGDQPRRAQRLFHLWRSLYRGACVHVLNVTVSAKTLRFLYAGP